LENLTFHSSNFKDTFVDEITSALLSRCEAKRIGVKRENARSKIEARTIF